MPLSWNEIKDRARGFSREWADEASEDAEAKSFWEAFFAEKAAGRKPAKLGTDAERVAFLFERYQALTSFLPAENPKLAKRKSKVHA